MSGTPNINVSYAAALINIEEFRSCRAESKYNPLPALIPELWRKLYSKAAEKFPSTKNLYLEKDLELPGEGPGFYGSGPGNDEKCSLGAPSGESK